MRALITIIVAAVALCAAGCGSATTKPSDEDQTLITAVQTSKQHLSALSARIDANQLEDEADIHAYIRDMRSTADEYDALGGTLERLPTLDAVRGEMDDYITQLGTTSGLARELATAVEDFDEKAVAKAEDAYVKASVSLSTIGVAIEKELRETQ